MIRSSLSREHSDVASDLLPDLTPMLDIIFILLIFFILTANSVQYALEVDLPKENTDQAQQLSDGEHIIIHLFPKKDSWGLGEARYDNFAQFSAELIHQTKNSPDTPVLIAGDKKVTMDKVMQLFSLLQKHNIAAADIMMERGQ